MGKTLPERVSVFTTKGANVTQYEKGYRDAVKSIKRMIAADIKEWRSWFNADAVAALRTLNDLIDKHEKRRKHDSAP